MNIAIKIIVLSFLTIIITIVYLINFYISPWVVIEEEPIRIYNKSERDFVILETKFIASDITYIADRYEINGSSEWKKKYAEIYNILMQSRIRSLAFRNLPVFKSNTFIDSITGIFYLEDSELNVYIYVLPSSSMHTKQLGKYVYHPYPEMSLENELIESPRLIVSSYYEYPLGKIFESKRSVLRYKYVLMPDMKMYILNKDIGDINAFFADPEWMECLRKSQPSALNPYPLLRFTTDEIKKIRNSNPDESFDWMMNEYDVNSKKYKDISKAIHEILINKYEELKKSKYHSIILEEKLKQVP